MPTTFEALAIFAAAIAPGYGFLTGYQHQRCHSPPSHDLHVLAQAFILSAIWVAITWWPIGHVLSAWAAADELGSHELIVWILACVFLGLPYVLGRIIGQVLRSVEEGQPAWLFKAMGVLGAFEKPTLWDWTWERVRRRGPVVIVIRLRDGGVIEGQYASASRVDFSPRKPRVFLEKAYGFDPSGKRVVYPHGAYLEGSEIVAVQFKT